jgi:hypothetical protein
MKKVPSDVKTPVAREFVHGAVGETRTLKPLRALASKASAYTSSATTAGM